MGHLGAMLGHLGAMLSHLGVMLGDLGAMLGLCWAILGLCWGKGVPPKGLFVRFMLFFMRSKNTVNYEVFWWRIMVGGRRGQPYS